MRPGTNVAIQSQSPPNTPPVNTGTWFVAGIASQGSVAPQVAYSFSQWQNLFGGRGTNPLLSDSVETYFAQGGSAVYTARVVGPGAATATVTLKDSSSAPSLTVSAIGPGAYANGYQIVVASNTDGSYSISVKDASGNVLEESNELETVQDAVSYGANSSTVSIAVAGANPPAVGTSALAGGLDDIASITTTQYQNALALFTRDLGPGRVSVPGVCTTAVLTAVVVHCNSAGPPGFRMPVLDLPDVTEAATLLGDAASIRALGTQARPAGLFTPWMDIAPVTGTSGNRAVPPSAFYAGLAARSDAVSGNPALPIAGKNGQLVTAVNAHATFSDSDRQTLNTGGINVIRPMASGFRIYGNVTPVDRNKDPDYYQLSMAALDMAILAQAEEIQEDNMFALIDGNGVEFANYGGELTNMMTEWQVLGALYPDVNGNFFTVDDAADVNTPTTVSEGELIATIAYARAPGAEQVNLNIVRNSTAGA